MYKIFKSLLIIIWIIDIFNINFNFLDIEVAYFLDNTIPINFWFWFLVWICLPASEIKKED